jgi:hypothetical protein
VTEEINQFEGLPTIVIAHDALQEILVAGANTQGIFSCNANGEVWPAARRGRMPAEERSYLDMPALEEIVGLLLAAWPSGGRFRIVPGGVILLANDEPLFAFAPIVSR